MPITKSAIKKLRQDQKRHLQNKKILSQLKRALRIARIKPTPKNIQSAFSIIDTAAKKNVIHLGKANRLKSRISQKSPPRSKNLNKDEVNQKIKKSKQ